MRKKWWVMRSRMEMKTCWNHRLTATWTEKELLDLINSLPDGYR